MAFNLFLKPALANLFIGRKQSERRHHICSIHSCAHQKFSLPASCAATKWEKSQVNSRNCNRPTVRPGSGLEECHARNATVTIIGYNSPKQKETRAAKKGALASHTRTDARIVAALKHTSNWLQNCNNNNNNSICPQQMLVCLQVQTKSNKNGKGTKQK